VGEPPRLGVVDTPAELVTKHVNNRVTGFS
jgi:hypothetical protein